MPCCSVRASCSSSVCSKPWRSSSALDPTTAGITDPRAILIVSVLITCRAAVSVDQGDDGRVAAQPSRQRARVGPMLPTGMPSLAPISAYGMGGSSGRAWQSAADRLGAGPSEPRAAPHGARPPAVPARPSWSVPQGRSRCPARPGRLWLPACAQDSGALTLGRRGQPARKRSRISGPCPSAPPDAARRSGRRPRRPRRTSRCLRQMDQISGRTAPPVRPTPADRRSWRGIPDQR